MTSLHLSNDHFNNKIALIAGGGTGIGLETARTLVAQGAKVVLTGRRESVLNSAAQSIDPTGEKVAFIAGDIGLQATSFAAVALAVARFGGLDILVNSAGVFLSKSFLEHTEADLDEHLNVGLKGTFFACQAAIPEMRKRGGGAIVNVGSVIGSVVLPHIQTSALSATKAGVHMLTRNLAIEFAGEQIRVNAVAPAMVATPLYENLMTPEQFAEELPGMNAGYPLGRIGNVADVSAAIVYLASSCSSWITGTILAIDGGYSAMIA